MQALSAPWPPASWSRGLSELCAQPWAPQGFAGCRIRNGASEEELSSQILWDPRGPGWGFEPLVPRAVPTEPQAGVSAASDPGPGRLSLGLTERSLLHTAVGSGRSLCRATLCQPSSSRSGRSEAGASRCSEGQTSQWTRSSSKVPGTVVGPRHPASSTPFRVPRSSSLAEPSQHAGI